MEIHKQSNLKQASKTLNELLRDLVNKKILFLTSGGSVLGLLNMIDENLIEDFLTIGVLDERYDLREKVNIFAQITRKAFYKIALKRGCRFIDTRVKEDETQMGLVDRFENGLREWRSSNPDGVVIATLGIGQDGHTAGIMPFPEDSQKFNKLFENKDIWVAGYDASGKNTYPLRLTTTNPFLRKVIDHTICFVSGDEKRSVLRRVLNKEGSINEIPALILWEMEDVKLFTDL